MVRVKGPGKTDDNNNTNELKNVLGVLEERLIP